MYINEISQRHYRSVQSQNQDYICVRGSWINTSLLEVFSSRGLQENLHLSA